VKPSLYSIVVEGEPGPRYEAAFGGMRLEPGDGVTTIVGQVELQGFSTRSQRLACRS
jgi:hypothetical protein